MKFSYPFIKELVPRLPSKKRLLDELTSKSFEAEDLPGNSFEIKTMPNRYSDSASHWGLAKEAAALFNLKTKIEDKRIVNLPEEEGMFLVDVSDKKACSRYAARYFEIPKIDASPKWMQKVLEDAGSRPINAVVDIMNYVMLETGQPLHAFDYDKVGGKDKKGRNVPKIVVRKAKEGEKMTTLDGIDYELNKNDVVIADSSEPIAIAGIKGGKKAEVTENTVKIIVEAANFDPVSVYKTSKRLKLGTDASLRFSHGLNLHLVEMGMDRATVLLKKLLNAKLADSVDICGKLPGKKIIGFDIPKFNQLIGIGLGRKEIIGYLTRLGFKVMRGSESSFSVEVPVLRDDINIFEDLAEEVVRMYGYNKLKPLPPVVELYSAKVDDIIILKEKIRSVFTGFGFSEVYNNSFALKGDIKLENPIAEDKGYLRTDLLTGLEKNIEDNSRFFDSIRIFEIGNTFIDKKEETKLGAAIKLKHKTGESFLEMKGLLNGILKKIGLVDFFMRPSGNRIQIESDHKVIGFLSHKANSAFMEINLGKISELTLAEHEYRPLPKFPSIMRDLSLLVPAGVKVGDILEAIEGSGAKYVEDVDLIDYFDQTKFTFRIVFQANDRTLADNEANEELAKISQFLKDKFNITVR
jgi:phenylalanyl-tRNA synthetase beta chain